MQAALALARRGLGQVAPNPAVGCVLVKDGRVVGRGWTQPGGRPHAETEALRRAGEAARGACAYVTLEPCAHHGKTPPCAEALIAAGIARCIVAMDDPDPRVDGGGLALLRDGGVEVVVGPGAEAAAEVNAGYLIRQRQGRPLVTLKLATTLDGRIATDYVVNCAGIGLAARILPGDGSLSLDLFEHILRVNLIDTYTVLSVAARAMASLDPLDEDGARGVIVNTASVAYQDGQIGRAAYAASNGGVAALTLPAARELAQFGMRVMTIALGLFGSGMSAGLTPEVGSAIQAGLPFPKRMGRPGEYAMLVQQIVENPILNGEVIHIDSAVRLAPK